MVAVGLARRVRSRLGRSASIALLVAGVWALGLVISGFLVPVYGTAGESGSGAVTSGADTLVGVNGLGVVAVLAVPLAATALVGSALWLRAHPAGLPVAWTIAGLLAVFAVLAILSIGVFVLPVVVCLVIACVTSRPQPD